MTDNAGAPRSHAATVAMASLAIFVVVLAFLLIRLESGRDPAIAVGEHAAPGTEKRQLVLERRIVTIDRSIAQPSDSAAPSSPVPDSAPAPVTQPS